MLSSYPVLIALYRITPRYILSFRSSSNCLAFLMPRSESFCLLEWGAVERSVGSDILVAGIAHSMIASPTFDNFEE